MSDTVMLIHGLWMTPRSWEHWVKFYEARGCTVLTPAYPGLEVEVRRVTSTVRAGEASGGGAP